jgi:hypothetical protein
MLNPHAGEDLDFMHAKELVCVVDKDSFVAETEDNPALEVIVQLPYAEERYCAPIVLLLMGDLNCYGRRRRTSIIQRGTLSIR